MRNFLSLASYQILMRIGWIFKTESIIMPAVMDLLCGPGTPLAAWMRSWLPQLNRFGQSIPQLLFADRIRDAPRKKFTVATCSGLMGLAFLSLAGLWYGSAGSSTPWMRVSFLLLYGTFFVCFGINNLGFNTLQGKLVRYNYRGRLFLLSNSVGGLVAITAAWWLLDDWLRQGSAGVVPMFGLAGSCFLLAGCLTLNCREPYVAAAAGRQGRINFRLLLLPLELSRHHPQFRWLALIAALFGTSVVLFPHYQALYRATLAESSQEFSLNEMLGWVILQNAGTIVISWCAGPAADRFGNRLVLRIVMLLVGSTPLVALGLSSSVDLARHYYVLVFLLVGVAPVTIRVLNNFALELAPAHSHAHFLSALSLCVTLPVLLFSQVVGLLLPILGFYPLFLTVSGFVFLGWILTFFVAEPRTTLTNATSPADNQQ